MTLQDQIAALLAEAEPLRARHDGGGDELRLIVEQINALRAIQADEADEQSNDGDIVKRRGRKPKVIDA